jgi:SHS2 domain-containing protein
MQRYKLFEHTADIGLTAYGGTLAEAFANAAYGMFSIITDLRKVKERKYRFLELSETGPEALLFQWLNSLLYYFDVENLLFKKFDVKLSGAGSLKATCYGEKYEPSRHKLKMGIKAATYHMLNVDQEKNQIKILFDI